MKILETNLFTRFKPLIYLLILLFVSCKYKKKKEIIKADTSHFIEKKIDFNIEKVIEGVFMVEDYHEQFVIKVDNCNLKSAKSNNQVKYILIEDSMNQGDWDNDNNIDFEFMYKQVEDGETLEIVYAIISNCKYNYIVSEFFYDEDSFRDNFDVSHIKNIKNAKDYYKRNFKYQLNHNPNINNNLKKHMLQTFNTFLKNETYKR